MGQKVRSQLLPSSPHLWRLHQSRKGESAACPSSGLCCENTQSCERWGKTPHLHLLQRLLCLHIASIYLAEHHIALSWLLCMNVLVNKSHPSQSVIAIKGFVSLPLAPHFGSQKGQRYNGHKKDSYYNLEINLEHLGCSCNRKLLPSSFEQSWSLWYMKLFWLRVLLAQTKLSLQVKERNIFLTLATCGNHQSRPRICSWWRASRCCTSWCTAKQVSPHRVGLGTVGRLRYKFNPAHFSQDRQKEACSHWLQLLSLIYKAIIRGRWIHHPARQLFVRVSSG